MIKILYELIIRYILPLLKFAGVYITEEGFLKPVNVDNEDLLYQYNGKDIIVVKSDIQYEIIKSKKEEYEIFNPFFIARHIVFLANLVLTKINEFEDNENYDEDLDEFVGKTEEDEIIIKQKIEMKHIKEYSGVLNTIFFTYVDSSGNPVGEPLATFQDTNPIIATFGALIKFIKNYTKSLGKDFISDDAVIYAVKLGMLKYEKEKSKISKDIKGIQGINTLEENTDQDILDVNKIDYYIEPFLKGEAFLVEPWMKRKHIDFQNLESRVYSNMLLPNFTKEETPEESFTDAFKHNKWDDIDLSF